MCLICFSLVKMMSNTFFDAYCLVQFSSVAQSCSLRPHGLQHTRFPCPSPAPRASSNSCPSSWWYHPAISSSVVPFSSCLQSFPESWSFPVSQFFASCGQSTGVSASASVLPIDIQNLLLLLNFLQDGPVGSPCSPRDSQDIVGMSLLFNMLSH